MRESMLILFFCLVLVSAFFSSSETALMALNRYRLKHQVKLGKPAAQRLSKLLERPDRLLGVILIGNTFANVMASSIATLLCVALFGDYGVAIATIAVTLFLLIFAEIAPKTVAALYPQPIADFVSYPLKILLHILYPVVFVATTAINKLLGLFGITVGRRETERLTTEELRTVVADSGNRISSQHQDMLLRLLEMEAVSVEDVMVPRSDIVGINLQDDWDSIVSQLTNSEHMQLPLYRDEIDNVLGILHLKDALKHLSQNKLNKKKLMSLARETYFVPEGVALSKQLFEFKKLRKRHALVLDEYGDILGLITLEDILEEIVGEFSTEIPSIWEIIRPQADNTYEIDGSANLRELNRIMHWSLPLDGPKTLGGLCTEYLEEIPQSGICLKIAGYPLEIIAMEGHLVKTVKMFPRLKGSVQ